MKTKNHQLCNIIRCKKGVPEYQIALGICFHPLEHKQN